MINEMAAQLESLVQTIPGRLRALPEAKMVTPRAVGKWSNLQIVGHLCDSAIHNIRRIIEARTSPEPYLITPYNQDKWAEAQHYGTAPIEEIIVLWESLNRAMLRVISALPAEVVSTREVRLINGEQHTLEWLIVDYVEHIRHHLKQIFPETKHEEH